MLIGVQNTEVAIEEESAEVVDETRDGAAPEGWEAVQAEPEPSKGEGEEPEIKAQGIKEPVDNKPSITASTVQDEKIRDEKPDVIPATTLSSEKNKPNTPVNIITEKPESTSQEQKSEKKKPSSPITPVREEKTPLSHPKISHRRVDPSEEDTLSGLKV